MVHIADFEGRVAPSYQVTQRAGVRGGAGRPERCELAVAVLPQPQQQRRQPAPAQPQ